MFCFSVEVKLKTNVLEIQMELEKKYWQKKNTSSNNLQFHFLL